ncbi:MAG: hypothetical protein KGJ66_05995 [Alphaproteobacteria bacterium]|nr:hypothetical protein [Alphaproteobacteria bacterium]
MANSVMGSSAIGHALAFPRQFAVTGYFGVFRELDRYMTADVTATMIAFAFGTNFDPGVMPCRARLRERKNKHGAAAMADLRP